MNDDYLLVEKYRPKTIDDCVLTPELKGIFKSFIEKKKIPNLLLAGGPGVGKTTVAKALLNELGFDYYMINGSLKGGIDTLRNDIQQYASTVSLTGTRKFVILDEADYLNPQSTQPALRNFMEEFSNNCGFILTCNYKNRIIEPLHSRCSTIEFNFTKDQLAKLSGKFYKRLQKILDAEGIEYDNQVLGELILKQYPDWRAILNTIQKYSFGGGKIDTGILSTTVSATNNQIIELIKLLKNKDFETLRVWARENSDIEPHVLFRALFDLSLDQFKTERDAAQMVVTLGEYQYKDAFVVDKEINLVAALTEIMSEVQWK